MDKEEAKNHRVTTFTRVLEPDFGFKWGNRKRLRCVKIKEEEDVSVKSESGGAATAGVVRKKITSRIDRRVVRAEKEIPISLSPNRLANKNSDSATLRSNGVTENNRKTPSPSPEKEDRYYTTRGSLLGFEDSAKIFMETGTEDRGFVWPKLFISLSSKEKEEDFMAMKGCKLPQRPKKRAKFVQRSLLLVSPGAWLSDLCQERYEVREKKTSKKRPRGLKAMGSMESDSE